MDDPILLDPEKYEKLMTPEIEQRFIENPFNSHRNEGLDAKCIARFFNPYGIGNWLVIEAEKQEDGDWLMYCYERLFDWKWNTVSFNELKDIKVNYCGYLLPIEHDISVNGEKSIGVLIR